MKIGKPLRLLKVEPLTSPVPAAKPAREREQAPQPRTVAKR